MSDKVFVDTNVLVYCRDASEPEKQAKAAVWMAALWERRAGRLSYQVLQEFYVTVTAKLVPGLEPDAARRDVRVLLAWQPLPMDTRLLEGAWLLQDRYGFSWWDALIAAAAQAAGCRYLLSEDFQEGMEVGGLRLVNPFRIVPEDLG
ncbi:MAG: PIN domain-containing protein [Deltaproteobacteria bacterium]|nr:PIN domain-containing protein [Deltaproteobacteria bacterium]MBI4795227.1 PIN domain-containing protein [Deltaproteobacteria bacterium]